MRRDAVAEAALRACELASSALAALVRAAPERQRVVDAGALAMRALRAAAAGVAARAAARSQHTEEQMRRAEAIASELWEWEMQGERKIGGHGTLEGAIARVALDVQSDAHAQPRCADGGSAGRPPRSPLSSLEGNTGDAGRHHARSQAAAKGAAVRSRATTPVVGLSSRIPADPWDDSPTAVDGAVSPRGDRWDADAPLAWAR